MFSIVIPIYNEVENIKSLIIEIDRSVKEYSDYDIILVNDASTDNTLQIINSLKNKFNLVVVNNLSNKGQSYSIREGIKKSKNKIIITIDGDGQNNPIDIPILLEKYLSNHNIFLVGGIRTKRKDSLIKIISSKIANKIRSSILKDDCIDTGCSLKVFDRDIFLNFPFFDGIHRFLPALFKGYGYKTMYVSVDHRERKFGISKYGTINRLIRGINDIFKVLNIIKNLKNNN